MTDKGLPTVDALQQAATLAGALPFLRRYAGDTIVVKYGGHAMGDPELAKTFGKDIALLKLVGINPVVVHGGGPQINQMLERLQVKSSFVDGFRVTDAEAIDVVEMVLCGSVNKEVATLINEEGALAVGISGKDGGLVKASKLLRKVRDPASGIEQTLDLGFVGDPDEINPQVLYALSGSGLIPVIAPVAGGHHGETFNVNADSVAGAIAGAIHASRLLMLTDVPGVLDGNGRLIGELTAEEARRGIESGMISGGMIPKVETCLKAVQAGAKAAVIVNGRVPHACLLELFTASGSGTLIRAD